MFVGYLLKNSSVVYYVLCGLVHHNLLFMFSHKDYIPGLASVVATVVAYEQPRKLWAPGNGTTPWYNGRARHGVLPPPPLLLLLRLTVDKTACGGQLSLAARASASVFTQYVSLRALVGDKCGSLVSDKRPAQTV